MKPIYRVRPNELPAYSPTNHSGTINRRLISGKNVDAKFVEVVLGEIQKSSGAAPHAHPGIEQVCYLLQGRAIASVGNEVFELNAGECCYFPADVLHTFTAISEEPVRVLVIYSPPYGEDPRKVVR